MAYRIPDQWMDQFYAQLDIVQIVSAYVPLKRNGKRYLGLCPFHREKTPSFSVNAEKNLYYCFGCKAGGNAVQFVMAMEHLGYMDAVKYLADRMNMPLPEMQNDPYYAQRQSRKEKLYEINREAARYYHKLLWTDEGRPVLEYFKKRGLNDDVIRKFGLGASGFERASLTEALTEKGYDLQDLADAGLTVRREQKSFDMFRGRAMFPIIDLHGQVLGFGGRLLDKGQPKYLNTPDTPVFNKRLGVFGANLLRKARDLKRVILVEGYMDVVALTQFGIDGVAATLGTSLTEEQARLLKRFAPEIWISYDGDEAGQRAIMRAIGIFDGESIPTRVLFFPDGLDPDEFIRQRGTDAFRSIEPLPSVIYLMDRSAIGRDLSRDADRIAYAKDCCAIIQKVKEPVERDYYLGILSMKTGFSKNVLLAQMDSGGLEPLSREQRGGYRKSGHSGPASSASSIPPPSEAEKQLFALLASGHLPEGTVKKEDFFSPVLGEAAEALLSGETAEKIIRETEDDGKRSVIMEALQTSFGTDGSEDPVSSAQDCLRTLHQIGFQKKVDELKARMSSLPISDPERPGLLSQIMALQKEIRRLKAEDGK